MFKPFEQTLTFDDVLLVPQASKILPKDAILKTQLTKDITLNLPFLSSPMDTVTEHKMAIALALSGGLGVIHKNLSIDEQVEEVKKVKRFENGFIEDPMTVGPDDPIVNVVKIREAHGYKKVPVVDSQGRLLGLISDVDYFMPDHKDVPVRERMIPKKDLVLGRAGISLVEANKMIHDHRLRVLCVVDAKNKLTSIVTRKDIEKNIEYEQAVKNELKQLRVGAAIGVGNAGIERAEALIGAGVDVLVVDTAHGHSKGVISAVQEIKKAKKQVQVIAGNIATAEAAAALIAAGVDAVKVGIGPGSICTTRIVSGIGVPQLSAILEVVKGVNKQKRKVQIIADGGITSSGDIVKALAAGASAVMMGNMFAGSDETPGRVEFLNGRMFKVYRGMGSLEAMEQGSKDRYGQAHVDEKKKFVPEGVSGRVAYKGPVQRILYQLAGGLKSGMGYCGALTIPELQKKARFVRITNASLKESHPHDLDQMESAPNYSVEG
ncbi:MAG: IMP dehydrogenase [Patescibacteria group bacterium]